MSDRSLDLKEYIPKAWLLNDKNNDLSNFISILNSSLNIWMDDCDDLALRLRDPMFFPIKLVYAYANMLGLEICDSLTNNGKRQLLKNYSYITLRKGTANSVKRFISSSLELEDTNILVAEDDYVTRKTFVLNSYDSKTPDVTFLKEAVSGVVGSLLVYNTNIFSNTNSISIASSGLTTTTINDIIVYPNYTGIATNITETTLTDSSQSFPVGILAGSTMELYENGVPYMQVAITGNSTTVISGTTGTVMQTNGFSAPHYKIVPKRIGIPLTNLSFPIGATIYSDTSQWSTVDNIYNNKVSFSFYAKVSGTATSISLETLTCTGLTLETNILVGRTLHLEEDNLVREYIITANGSNSITVGGHDLQTNGFVTPEFYTKAPRNSVIIDVIGYDGTLVNEIKEWLDSSLPNYMPVNTFFTLAMEYTK